MLCMEPFNQLCLFWDWSNYLQVFDLFDVKRKGVIDFGDFVRSLNVFHPNAPQEDKIDCKFQGYDIFTFNLKA